MKGNKDRIGNSDGIGKADRIGNMDLEFRKVRGRREFMDEIKKFIEKNGEVEFLKLDAYFQYTMGASSSLIQQCLAVLENLGLIAMKEVHIDSSRYKEVYYIPKEQGGGK